VSAVTLSYLRLVFELPAQAEGELVAALADAGTLGTEELPAPAGGIRLAAYFAAGTVAPSRLPTGVRLVEDALLPAADWLAPYSALAQPIEVGGRLLLDPREPALRAGDPVLETPTGRLLLRVPARSAFGTGSHASTRLALCLLERRQLAGLRVLDVGAGSGVLALAAVAFGARRAVGLDVDPAAALLAGQHARLNDLRAAFWAGGMDALAPAGRFDLVVVNALPHEVLPEAARIAAAVDAGGLLVVSGVLATEGESTLGAWAAHRLRPIDTLAEEEWVAWTLSRW
jgi:ribosomal protein L11 methyltransferase